MSEQREPPACGGCGRPTTSVGEDGPSCMQCLMKLCPAEATRVQCNYGHWHEAQPCDDDMHNDPCFRDHGLRRNEARPSESTTEPIRHTFAGIVCVTIPAEDYEALRRPEAPAIEVVTCTSEQECSRLIRAAYEDGAKFRTGAENIDFRSEVFVYPDGRVVRFRWDRESPILPINEEAQAMVDRMVAENTPANPAKASITRRGSPNASDEDAGRALFADAMTSMGARVEPCREARAPLGPLEIACWRCDARGDEKDLMGRRSSRLVQHYGRVECRDETACAQRAAAPTPSVEPEDGIVHDGSDWAVPPEPLLDRLCAALGWSRVPEVGALERVRDLCEIARTGHRVAVLQPAAYAKTQDEANRWADFYKASPSSCPTPAEDLRDADLDRMTARECFEYLSRGLDGGEAAILKAVAMTRAHERRKWKEKKS